MGGEDVVDGCDKAEFVVDAILSKGTMIGWSREPRVKKKTLLKLKNISNFLKYF